MSTPVATTQVAITGAGATLSVGATPTAINYWETLSFSGAKTSTVNVTNATSPTAGTGGLLMTEILPTIIDAGTMELSGIYVPADPGQAALLSAFQNGSLQAFTLQLRPNAQQTTGASIAFSAYVTAMPLPDVQFNKEATFKSTLTITGAFTLSSGTPTA